MTQFSSKFDFLPYLKGVCLKIPKSMFAWESVNHVIVRLQLPSDTQAAIKQKKIHCGSRTIVVFCLEHKAIKVDGQRRRPGKPPNSVYL